jgi:hypothetical protein
MSVTSYITGPARRIALGSTVALIAIGVVACSSTTTPAPTRTAPTSIPMPDLVGQYWLNAKPKLDSLGWKGVLVKGPDLPANPQQRYRIVVQSPAPGEHLDPDSSITLQFGVSDEPCAGSERCARGLAQFADGRDDGVGLWVHPRRLVVDDLRHQDAAARDWPLHELIAG